jgi:formimidoylglutamate deiminase
LAWLVELAQSGPIHIHIAEQTQEVGDCVAWSGRRPVEWLLEHTAVDERWCLVHATHINDAELQGIAASGAVVGLCPVTEANLGDGIFPARAFLAHEGRIGIGSDSNVLIDSAEELRTLEYAQRLAHRGRNMLASGSGRSTARTLFAGALAGGAQVLQSPRGLVEGASLDVVSLDMEQPALLERRGDDILDSWVFSGGRHLVDCVWRAGERVVINGKHRHREAIVARYRQALKNLLR